MAFRAAERHRAFGTRKAYPRRSQKTSELISEIVSKVRSLETEFGFRFKDLRRIARNQLLILLKKSHITGSPELYDRELEKLIIFEKNGGKKVE